MKKILIVLLIGFMAQVIGSCDCKCPSTHQCKYAYGSSMTSANLDDSGLLTMLSQTDTMPKAAYGVRVSMTVQQNGTCLLRRPGSFFSEAWADCVCPSPINYSAYDTIRGITITTFSDFDGQHPARTDISSYFTFSRPGVTPVIAIPGFLQLPPPVFSDLEPLSFDLFLSTPPAAAGDYSFAVTFIMSGQKTLTVTTKSAHLQ